MKGGCWLRGVGRREERKEVCESVRVYVLVQGDCEGKKRKSKEGRLVV